MQLSVLHPSVGGEYSFAVFRFVFKCPGGECIRLAYASFLDDILTREDCVFDILILIRRSELDINGFSVYDVNGDGIPELFAYGDAGHRRYTYLLTVIEGKITLIDATYDIEVLGSGIIKSTFNAGYGDWLITYYDVSDIGDWIIKYRYKAWKDGTYSVGEDSYEESSPKVDKSFVDAEILRIIGNTTSIDVKYWENTEANRNQVFGG